MKKVLMPLQVRRILERNLTRWQLERIRSIEAAFDLTLLASRDGSVGDLLTFAQNMQLPAETRAGLVLLAVRGHYPQPSEFEPVVAALKRDSAETALAMATQFLPRSSRRVQLLLTDEDLVDVTRYAHQRRISGIPRVVKNLITSNAFSNAGVGVWENGVFGIGERRVRGIVGLSSNHWHRRQSTKGLLTLGYIALSKRFGRNPAGLRLLKFFATVPLPIISRLINRPYRPKYSFLISDQTVFLPEVPEESVSARLTVWKQVAPDTKLVAIVHDILPVTHPHYFAPNSNREHLFYVKLLCVANRLLVATNALRDEVLKVLSLYSKTHPDPEVIPLPLSFLPAVPTEQRHEGDKPYFLFVGGFEKRKGLSDLVDLFEPLAGTEVPFTISVMGAPWPEQGEDVWDTASRVARLNQLFKLRNFVSDDELVSIFAGSRAILYLSHAEGYGLPILEGLSFGRPVLCQATATNQELAAKYAGIWPHFNFDAEGMVEALKNLALSSDPVEVLGISPPNPTELPTSIEGWAQSVKCSRTPDALPQPI